MDQTDGTYTVYDVSTPLYLPSQATVGQSGNLNPDTQYQNSTMTTITGTDTNSWALNADTATTAWLCTTDNYIDSADPAHSSFTETDCLRIDASGNVLGFKTNAVRADGLKITLHT